MDPFFHTGLSISDSLKSVRKSVLIYETIIDSRDNLKSTIIVSQLPVKSWYDLFSDNTYADACLDRIIHKAFRLELNGKNMRNSN